MDSETIGRIFESDFSTKSSNGLGLYYTLKKVTDWGGQINAKSQINQGTTFKIELLKKHAKLQV